MLLAGELVPHFLVNAAHTFDGGDMDCGSGLILLIRHHMALTPEGGILELRSSEPSVALELPPWCKMTGHTHVATEELGPGKWRHFIQRGTDQFAEASALAEDKRKATAYEWRCRARSTGGQECTVYTRSFSWQLGQPASFEEKDDHPSCIEAALGALLSDVTSTFATLCRQGGLAIDELEANAKARLHQVLAHMGLEEGDPSISTIDLTVFITSPAPGEALRALWEQAKIRSPLFVTLQKACILHSRLVSL